MTLSGTTVTITPGSNVDGNSTIIYYVNDGKLNSDSAILSLIIASVNDAPVSSDVSGTVTEQVQGAINLDATDVDENSLTYAIVSSPANGTATISGSTVLYTSNSDTITSDSLTYKSNDGFLDSNVSTVTITISPVNDAPSATNQSTNIDEDVATSFVLSVSDPESDELSLVITSNPDNHSLTLSGTTATVTSAANFNGSSSISYKVNDGNLDSNVAILSLTIAPINDAPVSSVVSAVVSEQSSVTFSLNASDIDVGNTLTYSVVSNPTYGSVVLTGSSVTYTNSSDFALTDSFTYTASDGSLTSNMATASLSITPVNDKPIASNTSTSVYEQVLTAIDLSSVVSDPDLDDLTFVLISGPFNGTATFSGTTLNYQSNSETASSDLLTYKVSDGTLESETVVISLTILPVNDIPVVEDFTVTAIEQQLLEIELENKVTDIESDPVTFSIVSSPSNGTATLSGTIISYTSNSDTATSDVLTYKANDGTDDSESGTISITISPVNDAPIASNGSGSVDEQVETQLDLSSVVSDPEGDDLTIVIISGPFQGTATISGTQIYYTSTSDTEVSDVITFKVTDGVNDSNSAAFSININLVNDAPIATTQSITFNQNSITEFELSVEDSDGDSLSLVIVENPDLHSLTLSGTTATISPTYNFFGDSHVRYKVSDGELESNVVTLSMSILEVNLAPVLSGVYSTTADEDTQAILNIAVSDFNVNDSHTLEIISFEDNGTYTTEGTQITFTPNTNFNGTTSLVFRAYDGAFYSDSATATIVVSPVNDAPEIIGTYNAFLDEDSIKTLVIEATDIESDELTFETYSNTDNASITYSGTTMTFSPASNLNGETSFSFRAFDGANYSEPKIVSIYIKQVNDDPIINGTYSRTIKKNATTVFEIDALDYDGDNLTFETVLNPNNATINYTSSTITYTTPTDFLGDTQFSFRAFDGVSYSNVVTVYIKVDNIENTAPIITGSYSATINEDKSYFWEISLFDDEGDSLSLETYTNPDDAEILYEGNIVSYTPAHNFNGLTSFSIRATDGNLYSTIVTVNVSVIAVNDPPEVQEIHLHLPVDTTAEIEFNAFDPDGDPVSFGIFQWPSIGELFFSSSNIGVYTPPAGFIGSVSLTYLANDGIENSEDALIELNYHSNEHFTPLASDVFASVKKNTTIDNIILNATSYSNSAISYEIVEQPANGSVQFLIDSKNSLVSYTPNENFEGKDVFKYRVRSGAFFSKTKSVFIKVFNDYRQEPKSLGADVYGEQSNENWGHTSAIASDGSKYLATAPKNDGVAENAGSVRLKRWDNNKWITETEFIEDLAENNGYGNSVSMNTEGTIVAVSSEDIQGDVSNNGFVDVYEFSGESWNRKGKRIFGPNYTGFGGSISVCDFGTYLIVGMQHSDQAGANSGESGIYWFEDDLQDWVLLGVVEYGGKKGDMFGHDVSMNKDGMIFAISAPGSDLNGVDSGLVKIFTYNGINWVQLGNDILGTKAGDRFGSSLQLDDLGTTIVVGAPNYNHNGFENAGQTQVYTFNGDQWVLKGTPIFGTQAGEHLGDKVSMDSTSETIVIASPDYNNRLAKTGKVSVYQYDQNQWKVLNNPIYGDNSNERLGSSVGLSSDRTILIASAKNANAPNGVESGVVKVYNLINFKPVIDITTTITVFQEITNELAIDISDLDNDDLFISVVEQSSHGVVSVEGTKLFYSSDGDYLGEDSFVIKVSDGIVESEFATINLEVSYLDVDYDGVVDVFDNCIDLYNPSQSDIDGDGIGDLCDDDIDGDGFLNLEDVFPLDPLEWFDYDSDGLGDNSDDDIDGDGVLNEDDIFPYDADEWEDKDNDGIGDNEDLDDDGDGKFDPLVASGLLTPGTGTVESSFILLEAERFPKNKLTIINTNREVVFEASNYQNDWKGTYGKAGGLLPEGSYYYIFQRTPDEMSQEGWIYIKY